MTLILNNIIHAIDPRLSKNEILNTKGRTIDFINSFLRNLTFQ